MSEFQVTHTLVEWMQIVAFGALLGAAGQAIRVIPGLKKLYEEASLTLQRPQDLFSASKLVVSLLIGAVAGVLGSLTLSLDLAKPVSAQVLVTLLGIGYAGSDFIEAFVARSFPSKGSVPVAASTVEVAASISASKAVG